MQMKNNLDIAGIQSATSRQNTKDSVYAQNEMLQYNQRESQARVSSILANTDLTTKQATHEIMRMALTRAQETGQHLTNSQIMALEKRFMQKSEKFIKILKILAMVVLKLLRRQRMLRI